MDVCSDIICVLGALSTSAVLGLGLRSGRRNCGPRDIYDDVNFRLVYVCALLLARVLS